MRRLALHWLPIALIVLAPACASDDGDDVVGSTGETDTGDGDGEPGDGDGDPGLLCEPIAAVPCAECSAERCCDEMMLCEADMACGCYLDCLRELNDIVMCNQNCGFEPVTNALFQAIITCEVQECVMECGAP